MKSAASKIKSLRSAGFNFPHELGLFRSPVLSAAGSSVDPKVYGFHGVYPMSESQALQIEIDDFILLLTFPDERPEARLQHWNEVLITIFQGEDRERICSFAMSEWNELVFPAADVDPQKPEEEVAKIKLSQREEDLLVRMATIERGFVTKLADGIEIRVVNSLAKKGFVKSFLNNSWEITADGRNRAKSIY